MTRHAAATTRETFPQIGAMGYPIVVGLRGFDVPQVAAQLNVYRQAWQMAVPASCTFHFPLPAGYGT